MGAGRPREHDREQISRDLITWSLKEDSYNLNGFCAEQLIAPSKITEWARANDEFRLAYEIAKAIIAPRRERGLVNGTVHVKAYDINAAVYDHFLKEERRLQAEFEISLKAKETQVVSEEAKQLYNDLIDQFKSSKLNKDNTTINSAEKS